MKVGILKANSGKYFHRLTGINRDINPGHISKIARSINNWGCLRHVVVVKLKFITGKWAYYIIDGQHLYECLRRLGQDIPYIIMGKEIKDVETLVKCISQLNTAAKAWGLKEYVGAFANVYNDYKKLGNYHEIYDAEMNVVAGILGATSFSSATKFIKDGKFRIENEKVGQDILNKLNDVLTVLPAMDRKRNKYVCVEYVNFLRTLSHYNHERFIENLKKHKKKFALANQGEDTLSKMFKKLL